MRRRPFVIAAIAAGLAAGTVVAAVQSDTRAPARAKAAQLPPITAAPAREPEGRLPDGRYDAGYSHWIVEPGSIRQQVAFEDPGGEPAWAVRTYAAERRTITRPARTLDDYAYRQRYRCVELGRLMDGRFGWVYGDWRFRPHRPTAVELLSQCTSRKRPRAAQRLDTVVAFPSPSEPRLVLGAVWGLAPPGARSATLEVAGRRQALELHHGAFLALVDPALGGSDLRLTFRLAEGSTDDARLGRQRRVRGRAGRPVPGSVRIEARAPDPAGGPGWGVAVADRQGGGSCVGYATQVVGDRPGGVETDLALFNPYPGDPLECRPSREGPTRDRPLWISYGGGTDDPDAERDQLLRRARIERRSLTARFQLQVQCHPSVERVTIQSPRDIRTLVPSERGHVVFALYDDTFSSGEIVLTAHMRDGRTHTERLASAF